jgi:cobalt-zinc-cadmium efflux system membrane fusion protein
MMIRRVATVVALAIALAVQAARAADILQVAPDSELERVITVQLVERQPLRRAIAATAVIEPDANAVAHIATRISGRVVKVLAQLGQRVKTGEPLAILNSRQLGQAKTE